MAGRPRGRLAPGMWPGPEGLAPPRTATTGSCQCASSSAGAGISNTPSFTIRSRHLSSAILDFPSLYMCLAWKEPRAWGIAVHGTHSSSRELSTGASGRCRELPRPSSAMSTSRKPAGPSEPRDHSAAHLCTIWWPANILPMKVSRCRGIDLRNIFQRRQ